MQDIYGLDLQASLVVLSACRTGLGQLSSDGIVGLTRAFFYAGAPSVVATLWDVADEPTFRLVSTFYSQLAAAPDKALALRAAQLSMLRALRAGEVKVPIGGYRRHPAGAPGALGRVRPGRRALTAGRNPSRSRPHSLLFPARHCRHDSVPSFAIPPLATAGHRVLRDTGKNRTPPQQRNAPCSVTLLASFSPPRPSPPPPLPPSHVVSHARPLERPRTPSWTWRAQVTVVRMRPKVGSGASLSRVRRRREGWARRSSRG